MINFIQSPPVRSRRRRWPWYTASAVLFAGLVWASASIGGSSFTVTRGAVGLLGRVVGDGTPTTPTPTPLVEDPEYALPDANKGRLDILLLGVRGRGDAVNGGLLTDTIMLLSLDTESGRASLVSVPRDFTVRLTDDRTEKINAAYAHYGVAGAKRYFSRVLGTSIDNVVVMDFTAFQHIVDALGGITITLDQPFEESQQWAGTASESYAFRLPAGSNNLTGEQALYYVRSRYSSSDFDRARRQQQVMLAIKQKAEALDLTNDPIRALTLITTVRKHVDTDLNILDLGALKDLMAHAGNLGNIRRYQLTTENLLYETKVDGIYELLPRGDTLAHLKRFIQTVLDDTPVMVAPTPTPSGSPAVTP
jgi:LCP family protein required for cell wall assembly